MMLKVISSSSTGNCYLLITDTECLILEAGVRFMAIKKTINFEVSKIVGAVSSHLHADHSLCIPELIRNGIHVLAGEDNFQAKGIPLNNAFVKVIEPDKGYKMGNFKILPAPVEHDVPCYSFLISHPEMGNLYFITDTYYCPYEFSDLNHLMIEVNYSDDILETNINDGLVHPSMRLRLLQTHMELSSAMHTLRSNDLSNVINIVLIHLSSGNSNSNRFVREIAQVTGKNVFAAGRGMEIEFNNQPY